MNNLDTQSGVLPEPFDVHDRRKPFQAQRWVWSPFGPMGQITVNGPIYTSTGKLHATQWNSTTGMLDVLSPANAKAIYNALMSQWADEMAQRDQLCQKLTTYVNETGAVR